MNLRTTLVLLVLAVAGGVMWQVGPKLPPALDPRPAAPPAADLGTLDVLEKEFTADGINSVDVSRDGVTLLSFRRDDKGGWAMPGGWRVREAEVNALIDRLVSLRSRFAPIPLAGEEGLKQYGLDDPEYTVVVGLGGSEPKTYRLTLAQGEGRDNSFHRPVYARLGDRAEVVQLSPGFLADLGRPRDYYQQRELFPSTREARSEEDPDRVIRLDAERVEVADTGEDGHSFTLAKGASGWHLSAPTTDRLDPEKAGQVREVIADLWAERFVQGSPADAVAILGSAALTDAGLAGPWTSLSWSAAILPTEKAPGDANWRNWLLVRSGLDKPERTIRVTHAGGTAVLQIGRVSATRPRPAPPPRPDMPFPPEAGSDEFRYAKLADNDQIFEIRADRLKDLFVAPATLRETRLARFEPKDIRRVEVFRDGAKIAALFRDGEKTPWKVEVPGDGTNVASMNAEESKVEDLLRRLSGLNGQTADTDAPGYGAAVAGLAGSPLSAAVVAQVRPRGVPAPGAFDRPLAVVKLTVEDRPEAGAASTTKEIRLTVGEQDTANKLLLVRVDDWPRVELVEDDVLSLIRRPSLAYRGKLFDFTLEDVQKVIVEQEGKGLALEQTDNRWQLVRPSRSEADSGRVGQLVTQLARLEPAEYVNENPTPEELESKYGLTKQPLTVTVQADGALKTLRVGKQVEDKQEYYARLDGTPSVFVVDAELRSALRADALSYLPLRLWNVETENVRAVRVEKEGGEPFDIERQGDGWKVSKPQETAASQSAVRSLLEVLTSVHCERYEPGDADDAAKYGFDKPYLKLKLTPGPEGGPARELIVGKPVDKEDPDRYARTGEGSAVCVLRADVVKELDRGPLELIETLLLDLPLDSVQSATAETSAGKFTLKPEGETWKVVEGPGAPYPADINALTALRSSLLNLRADRYAAYGSNPDLAKFGLDKPFATLTLAVNEAGGKTRQRVLTVGAEVPGGTSQRYARLDQGPGIAVLSPADTRSLTRSHLDYVDHRMLRLSAEQVQGVKRVAGTETLELTQEDDEWRMVQPQAQPAEPKAVDVLIEQLAGLRAAAVAEFPLKDEKKYGLDMPAYTLTVRIKGPDGKPAQHVLKVGAETPAKNGERYARVDDGQTVFVLPERVVKSAAAPALVFRSRSLARFSDAEQILHERGGRRATFARVAGSWSMTAPITVRVDNDRVEEFLSQVARLTADELVADKPADLKPYGLDRPVARWRFRLDDRDVLDLLVGKEDGYGRAYAKLYGGDLVFLLRPDLTKTVLGEFRDRTIWSMPLDASQAETLRLKRGDKTVVLKKEDTAWKVEGRPEVMLNVDAVNDTLAALAGLKLERYAADAGADRKLYGLEPPELVIEAEAAGRVVVLHVGRFEGDSKRAYACLPDRDRTDVFVLSEADTARLTRDLDALSKPPKPARP